MNRMQSGAVRDRSSVLAMLCLLVLAPLVACGESDPIVALEAQRAQYTAELQGGFYVDERVVETPTEVDAEGNEVSIEPIVEKDILLEILVQNEADKPLQGLTVDLEHVDASGSQKAMHRIFLDVSGIGRGNVGQFSRTLENADYVEGDAFSASVRTPIPEGERSEYQEFAGVGG